MIKILLDRLEPSLARSIRARLVHRAFETDEYLIHYKDINRDVFFVETGSVRVENYSSLGRLIYHAEFGRGSILGHYAALGDLIRTANVIASKPSEVIICSQKDFISLVTKHPENAHDMMRQLVSILQSNTKRLDAISGQDAYTRVATYVAGEVVGGREVLYFPRSEALASYLNMTRETLSRILADMIQDGAIRKIKRGVYQVLDKERLIG